MKLDRYLVSAPLVAALAAVPGLAGGAELRTTLDDQREVAVTIYNEDLALVKDRRRVELPAGASRLAFREVSAAMRPETALLRAVDGAAAVRVVEQNFDFDLLTPQKLLEKYVGRIVRLVKVHPQTGAEQSEEAVVLSANNGVVLRVGDRIEMGIPGRLTFPDVPANLRDRPTLALDLTSAAGGVRDLELSYLTGGLSWRADYVAELGADDETLDLHGWVTLTNRSGTSYRRARLQLVAGDVNRVRPELVAMKERRMELAAAAAVPDEMAQETLFEYHLYTLGRPTDIADNQTKQVALLGAAGVPVMKEYVLRGADYYYRGVHGELGRKVKVGVFVQFENSEGARLGKPLPRGVIRVYKKDASGNAQFVGEDAIDHTPKNETVRLKLGDAFDVTADRRQTDFEKGSKTERYRYVFESAYEIVLRNAKTSPVTVTVREPVPGDWKMLSESHPHRKVAAGTAEWRVDVPPEGKTELRYRTIVRF